MAKTSIIDVQVRDAAFQTLKAQFDAYNQHVQKQPAAWAAVSKQAAAVGASIHVAQNTMAGLTAGAQLAVAGQRNLNKQVATTQGLFNGLTRASDKLAANIHRVTNDIKAWASFGNPLDRYLGAGGLKNVVADVGRTLLASGLLGGGGLFGLDLLGRSVSAQRRSALGTGVSTAEQSAFRLNFGRYTDADGMLGRVADAKSDWSKRWAFSALGIDQQQVDQMDPADLARQVIRRSKDVSSRGDGSQQYAQSHGLLEFSSMDDLRRYQATPDADLDASDKAYDRDKADLNISSPVQKAWQDLATQLDRAGAKIEAVFVTALAPLAPGITKLSDAFAAALKTFLENPHLKQWMDDLGQGLEHLATYVGTDEFRTKVTHFADDLGKLVDALGSVIEWFAGKFGPGDARKAPGAPGSATDANGNPSSIFERWSGLGMSPAALSGNPGHVSADQIQAWKDSRVLVQDPSDIEATAAKRYGVPLDFAKGIYKIEAGTNRDGSPRISPAGAIGLGQLMPDTANDLGVNPYDTRENVDGSTRYMQQLLRKFNGDELAAAAAYNAGPNSAAVAAYARDHDASHLPEETRRYVNSMRLQGLGGTASVPPNPDQHESLMDLYARTHPDSDYGPQAAVRRQEAIRKGLERAAKPKDDDDLGDTLHVLPPGMSYNAPVRGGGVPQVNVANNTGGSAIVTIGSLAA